MFTLASNAAIWNSEKVSCWLSCVLLTHQLSQMKFMLSHLAHEPLSEGAPPVCGGRLGGSRGNGACSPKNKVCACVDVFAAAVVAERGHLLVRAAAYAEHLVARVDRRFEGGYAVPLG